MGVRIFGAQVDVTARCANGDASDRHALDEGKRIAFHQHAVREGTRVALVGIAGHVLLRCRRIEHRLPLDASRERRTTAAAQTGVRNGLNDLRRLHLQRLPQAAVALVLHVVLNVGGFRQADPRERQTLLVLEIRYLLGQALMQAMLAALQELRIEQS